MVFTGILCVFLVGISFEERIKLVAHVGQWWNEIS